MKENSRMWRFFFGEDVSRPVARILVIADVLIIICAVLFVPCGDERLFDKARQAVKTCLIDFDEQRAQKEIKTPIEGYDFVKFYHLVVAEKNDKAVYYGQQAAIFKGKKDYLLCYKADDNQIKKISFKKWGMSFNGIIIEDRKVVRFADASPEQGGCEFYFCKNNKAYDTFYSYK